MGGGISSVLPQNLANTLTNESKLKFHAYETKCIEQQMSIVNLYINLIQKYEDLKMSDQTSLIRDSVNDKKISMNNNKANYSKPISRAGDRSITGKKGKGKQRRHSLNVLPSVSLVKIDDLISPVVVEENNITNYDQQISSTTKINTADSIKVVNTSVKNISIVNECTLCNKTFATHSKYLTHIYHSEVHAANMKQNDTSAKRREKRVMNLQTIASDNFTSLLKEQQDSSCKYAQSTAVNQGRWKRAAGRTVQISMLSRIKSHIERLNKQTRALDPKEVLPLYKGSKLFWRLKRSCDFHLYLHIKSGVVEVVSILLPSFEVDASSQGASVKRKPLESKPCDRLYLNYDVLLRLLFGTRTEDEKAFREATLHQTLPERELLRNFNDDQNINILAKYVLERIRDNKRYSIAATTTKRARAKGDHDPVGEECSDLQSEPVEQTTLYFDDHNMHPSPLILSASLPDKFTPVHSDLACVKSYQQWEIDLKMQQLAESGQSLAEAVSGAEKEYASHKRRWSFGV